MSHTPENEKNAVSQYQGQVLSLHLNNSADDLDRHDQHCDHSDDQTFIFSRREQSDKFVERPDLLSMGSSSHVSDPPCQDHSM